MADDFDIARIDEVIHGRIRLGIMAYLAGAERADFNTPVSYTHLRAHET